MPKILVADDDPDILESITSVLKSQSYRLHTARDGQTCLEMVKKRMPDLLILDMLMPKLDGFAVIRELWDDPQYADIPIVVLTALHEDATRRRYELETQREMNVQCYLEKPVAPRELLRCVEEIIEKVST